MPKTWSISGVDLHLDLGGSRRRAALEAALREAVRTGRLSAGLRLPSSRALAGDLGISRNTVAAAYGQLVAEGWLTARQGSGTRVAARPTAAVATPRSKPVSRSKVRLDLSAGSPDLAGFPRSGWLSAARRALTNAPSEALGYSHPLGRPELRRALADYLARARGVHAAPDRIVVCSGFAQGLALLCQVLHAGGAMCIGIEEYGHQSHLEAILASGLRAETIPVDPQGVVVEELDEAEAVLLTPAHQFPLGPSLAAERRTLVVDWARETGAVLIEDDYDGEFRYDRQPLGAMQALAPEQVVYAGTASKSLAPGLRLGWLVLPQRLIAEVATARGLTGGPSSLDQLALAEFIASGAYDRQVRRQRLVYRGRRDALVAALGRRVPKARISGIAAGLHVVVELPSGRREDEVVTVAKERGLRVEGLTDFRIGGQPREPALVVGYGTPTAHAFGAAIGALCRVLA